jgi:flagellar assembly factor FliW
METSQQFPIFPIESYPISQNNGFFPSSSSPTNSVSKMMVVNQSYIPSYPQPPVKISNNSTVKNRGILKINSKDFEMAINYQCEMIINQFSTVL